MKGQRFLMTCILLFTGIFFSADCAVIRGTVVKGEKDYNERNYDLAIEEFKSCMERKDKYVCHCSFMLGQIYLEKKQYQEAITHIKRTLDLTSQVKCDACGMKPAWHYSLGKAYYEKRQYENAITHYKESLSLAPREMPWHDKQVRIPRLIPIKSACYNALGKAYFQNKQYREAAESFNNAIEFDPAKGDFFKQTYRNDLARCYIQLGQYDDAIKSAYRSVQEGNPYAYLTLGDAYCGKKNYEGAIRFYRKLTEIKPDYPVVYTRICEALSEMQDYKGASEAIKKAAELSPTYTINLARFYYRQGSYDNALDAINQYIALSTYTGTGMYIEIVNETPVVSAITPFGPAEMAGIKADDRIIEVNGETTKGWDDNRLTQKLRGQEGTQVSLVIRRDNIENPLEKTVARGIIYRAEIFSSFAHRSLILRKMERYKEALEDANKSVIMQGFTLTHIGPAGDNNDIVQIAMGAAYIDNKDYAKAIKTLSTVKNNIETSILNATAYAKNGNCKEAIALCNSIPEEEFSSKNAPLWSDRDNMLEALKLCILPMKEDALKLKAQGQYREALVKLGEVIRVIDYTEMESISREIAGIITVDPGLSLIPEEARKYALRGDVLTKDGKFEEAIKEYHQAIQAAPYIPNLYYNTSLLYGEMKKYPLAIHHMKIYSLLAPEAPNIRAAKDQIYKWEFMMERGE